MNISIKSTKTFTLTQEDVMMIVADYLTDNTDYFIKPTDLTLNIQDRQHGDYYDSDKPARIKNIVAVVEDN